MTDSPTPTVQPIRSLLVANRGEIAIRIFRTARQMGIHTTAVFVDADAESLHLASADRAVRLPSGSYLDQDAIIAAARAGAVDAIHPGYGFLSENAGFAAAVQDAGLVWIGPAADSIDRMGDKIRSKQLAEAAGVPTLAHTDDESGAAQVGFPLMIKASAGGGGKGMRIVREASEILEAASAARREALAAFGDDRIFFERYVPRSRHVEVQVLGDRHGSIRHLGERECSIQRRHQKLIEESPSPAITPAVREAMTDAAVRLATAIGYHSLGTVEFLVDDSTGEFYFLEMNTRLQVEHPVTEAVTGIDLVREQLRIAEGHPLSQSITDAVPNGWAIEARLNAEDPSAGFLPATGTFEVFDPAPAPEVRWDLGVRTHSVVGVAFDPMLGKVIAHAPTRSEAASALASALEGLFVGGVTTNAAFLANVLRSEAFIAGDTTTDFIERVAPGSERPLDVAAERNAAIVAALWLRDTAAHNARVLAWMRPGWRNARLPAEPVAFDLAGRRLDLAYRSDRSGTLCFDHAEGSSEVRLHSSEPRSATGLPPLSTDHVWRLDVEVDGIRARYRVAGEPDSAAAAAATTTGRRIWVDDGRSTIALVAHPRFVTPGAPTQGSGLVAPMPGVVLEVRVAPGDAVASGDTLLVLEAMKMEHHVKAAEAGTVIAVHVTAGDHVANGAQLIDMDLEIEMNNNIDNVRPGSA